MLKNYFKIAYRNLVKHKAYSFINTAGLAIGIACCILILLYVKDELTYDAFHVQARSIYRITVLDKTPGEESFWGLTQPTFASVIQSEIPEVINTIRLFDDEAFVSRDGKILRERLLLVDAPFFEMFSFKLLRGDPAKALRDPHSVVLTPAMAEKYFGNADPMGRTISFRLGDSYRDLLVTGIAEQPPENSSIKFDFVLSFERLKDTRGEGFLTDWGNEAINTFVLLKEGVSGASIIPKLEQAVQKYIPPEITKKLHGLQPLTDLHLNTAIRGRNGLTPSSNPSNSYILSAIALFILAIACFNFMNLSIGQSTSRGKEVGMRKVLGAFRAQLARQFLGEALLYSALGLALGLVLAELFLPTFNALAGKQLSLNYRTGWTTFAGLLGLMLVVGVAAGSYPALFLSRFQSVQVLRKSLRFGSPSLLSRTLIVLQFVLSIILIIGTVLVRAQVEYLQMKDLGFQKEQMVIIPTKSSEGTALYERFRNEVESHAGILGVTGSEYSLGGSGGTGISLAVIEEREIKTSRFGIDYNYLEVLGVQLVEGRNFSKRYTTDLEGGALVNETFVRQFGLKEPIGKRFQYNTPHTIIGVVKDFHFYSLRGQIQPLVLYLNGNNPVEIISVRIKPAEIPTTLEFLRNTWTKIAPHLPFEYSFLDEELDSRYRNEQRWASIVGYSSIFAIAIACFGLYGLTMLAAARRTKEIGIRKVLGASVSNLVHLLSQDFVKLVLLANVIAWPMAYFAMNRWLQNFAYRIDISWWGFTLAGGLALIIALLTVSSQAIKAALANPVEALRYE